MRAAIEGGTMSDWPAEQTVKNLVASLLYRALKKSGGNRAQAAAWVGMSYNWVGYMIRTHDLFVEFRGSRPHGGRRAGAGRPKGSKNISTWK